MQYFLVNFGMAGMKMRKVIRGSISQSSSCFPMEWRGMQCTIIAFAALAFAFRGLPNVLTEDFVNDILFAGHEAYTAFLTNLGENSARLIGHDEIPDIVNFQTMNLFVKQTLYENHFGMFEVSEQERNNFGMTTLDDALFTFFDHQGVALFTAGALTIALFHHDGRFVIFDSHPDQFGVANLRFFDSRDDFLYFLRKNYGGQMQFEISYFYLEMHATENENNDHDVENFVIDDNLDNTDYQISRNENNVLTTEPPLKKRRRGRPPLDDSHYLQQRNRRIEATISSVISDRLPYACTAISINDTVNSVFQQVTKGKKAQKRRQKQSLQKIEKRYWSGVPVDERQKLFKQDLKQFETSINEIPCHSCTSCDRFLYSNEQDCSYRIIRMKLLALP